MNPIVLRVVTTSVVAAAAAGLCWLVSPLWEPGHHSLFAAIGCALINAMIAQVLIVQPLLGYWVEEESGRHSPMSAKARWVLFAIGVVVMVVSALTFPYFDRHAGSDNI